MGKLLGVCCEKPELHNCDLLQVYDIAFICI